MIRLRQTCALLVGALVAGVLAACSGSSGPAPIKVEDHGTIKWSSCNGSFQCGTVTVPIDYAHPDGKTIDLAVVRRPAQDQAHKIGSLLVNPGGPGASGVEFAQYLFLPGDLMSRFDIVGFDPRGVGGSAALNCDANVRAMYDADPIIDNAAEKRDYLAVSRKYVAACATKNSDLLPFMGTRNVARDLDRIRAALGEKKVNYLGYSYGTSIGQMYAQLFPKRIRTMVLDGVVNLDQTGLQAADDQAGGFSLALNSYLAWCKSTDCALGADPTAAVAAIQQQTEQQPIPSSGGARDATAGVFQLGVGQALYAKSLWPRLTKALVSARKGDGAGLVGLADDYLSGGGFGVYFAVSCLDSAWPRKPAGVFANAKATGKKYPIVGEGLVNDYVRCPLWPVKPDPLPNVTAAGSPPIVVISTTRDPATPYANGVKLAEKLPKGYLISNDGDGHTVFAQGKACVDDPVVTYFDTTQPPKDGLRC